MNFYFLRNNFRKIGEDNFSLQSALICRRFLHFKSIMPLQVVVKHLR